MTMELWAQVKKEDWALVAESGIMSDWTVAAVELARSTTSRLAAPAARASATARPRRLVPRSRTRSAAGCQ